jgi:hypothetical protein
MPPTQGPGPAVKKKKVPEFIFGKRNPAYQAGAKDADVAAELKAILARSKAKGLNPSMAAVLKTYQNNLARKAKVGQAAGRTGDQKALVDKASKAAFAKVKAAKQTKPATQTRERPKRKSKTAAAAKVKTMPKKPGGSPMLTAGG